MKIQDKELEKVLDEIQKEIQRNTGKCYTANLYDCEDEWFSVCIGKRDVRGTKLDIWISMYVDDWRGRSKFETDELSGIETPTDEEAYYMFVDKINENFKRIVK